MWLPLLFKTCGSRRRCIHSSIDMWYLHGPDRGTPYEVTLKAVNDLYKEGKFKRFGISNYYSCVSASHTEVDYPRLTRTM